MLPREPYKLREWIDPTKIDWKYLSGNRHPHAIQMLEDNPEKIDWWYLCGNPYAIHLLEKRMKTHPEDIDWNQLLYNSGAIELVEKNPDKINYWKYISIHALRNMKYIEEHLDSVTELVEMVEKINEERIHSTPYIPTLFVPTDNLSWSSLSYCSCAIHLLTKNKDKIDWHGLSSNSSPEAIRLLETHPERIEWSMLSRNTSPKSMRILEENFEKIDWWYLSENSKATSILEKYPEKIIWAKLCENRSKWAIQRLEEAYKVNPHHPREINWIYLSQNPSIFTWNETYDYTQMKEHKQPLHEDLIRTIFHPDNLSKLARLGIESGWDEEEEEDT